MPFFRKISFLFLLVFTGLCAQAQDTLLTKRLAYLSDNKGQTALDSLVNRLVKGFMQSPQNHGLSIGVSQNGTHYFYNYGETKRGSKILPSPATVYEIGSVTTTFCGILLAQAIIERRLKQDDDIRHYLPGKYPDLDFNKTPIQVKHLANHTSGLPQIPADLTLQPDFDSLAPYKNYSEQKMYAALRNYSLTVEPGSTYDYSAFGIAILGIILEKVYGQPFDALVREKICAPNNIINTGVQLPGLHQMAEGHNENGKPTPAWGLGAFVAAGGLHSSSADMLTYLAYNQEEKDAAVRLSHAPTYTARQTLGLCWFLKKTKYGNTLIWNNGATYGFSSFCGYIKEKNYSVVVLSNSPTNVDYIGIAILNYLQQ